MNSLRLGLLIGLIAAVQSPLRADQPRKVDFSHDILPILKARCAACHTNGKYKGSLSMDSRADLLKSKVVVPGKSGESELIRRVSSTDPEERMPSKGKALAEKEIVLLRAWIDQGVSWEEGFTFKKSTYQAPLKPRRPSLPPAQPGREHPIDRIVDAYFAQHKLAAPQLLDDRSFARRACLDLIGLLPATEELQAFVNDTAADKRTRLIRRLLADRRACTEHWLTFWNDLLRNDYQGIGFLEDGRKQITAWLYRSLLENKPYDRFARELIHPTPESEGFIYGIRWRGRVNASQVRELQFSQNVSQVFFGVNLKCASCHDSFIDSWKLDDAYGLAAIVAEEPLEMHRCDKPLGKKAVPHFLWPELGRIDASLPRDKRLEQLAALVTHPDNGRFTRTIVNRIWQRLFGRGLVHPVDVMANPPWSVDLLDYLALYLSDHGYDLQKLLEHIATSQIYQSRSIALREEPPANEYVFRGPQMHRMTAEQFLDAIWQITGTAPAKPQAQAAIPAFSDSTPTQRRFTRAALVFADPLMRSLGRPNREQVVTTRPDELATLQALDLTNGQILADTLARGAANLLRAHEKDTPDQHIQRVYQSALCRPPTDAEMATCRGILGSPVTGESLADLLWAVVLLPEFELIR